MGGEDAYDIANQKNCKMIRVYIYKNMLQISRVNASMRGFNSRSPG